MARRSCEQCAGMDDSKLDEIRSTLWAISVVAKRMTREIDELRELRGTRQAEAEHGSVHGWY